MAVLATGADSVGGERFGNCEYNDLKNHWRMSDPCANLANLQPGMIVSDEDDDRLYVASLVSGCGCSEILQACVPLSDDKALGFGDDWNAQAGYDELTNDALILGVPVSPERGVIVCDIADIGVDFTGLITASVYPVFWFIDLDNDSYLGVGHQADDRPGIWSGAADASILAIQYEANADVTFFENSGAGENRNIYVYGYITAGAAVRHGMIRLDDTWDELVLEAENNANLEGITISLLETNQRFRIRQNADIISIYLDGSDAFLTWSDGALNLQTDEADTHTFVHIHGNGTGRGQLVLYDADDAEWLVLSSLAGSGYITTGGATPGSLELQSDQNTGIRCWSTILSGNPNFTIYGWITAGGARRYSRFRMDDTWDEFEIEAENNVNHEGITILIQEANQKFRVRGAGRALRFYVKSDGEIGTNQIVASGVSGGYTPGVISHKIPIYDENQVYIGDIAIYETLI